MYLKSFPRPLHGILVILLLFCTAVHARQASPSGEEDRAFHALGQAALLHLFPSGTPLTQVRYAAHPGDARQYDTARLRQDFLIENLDYGDQDFFPIHGLK